MPNGKPNIQHPCEVCGGLFMTWPCEIRAGNGRYCSRACAGRAHPPQRRDGRVSPGQRFGRLTVAEEVPERTTDGAIRWICRCDCGTTTTVTGRALRAGNTSSCGCYNRDLTTSRNTTHGQSSTEEYRIWAGMRARCERPAATVYHHYGGRGITVDPSWASFVQFFADMGPRPTPKHSIERVDNDGPYSKQNCRWGTQSEQCRNTRRNLFLTHDGVTMTVAGWADQTGFAYHTIMSRLKHGWTTKRTLTEPLRRSGRWPHAAGSKT